MITEAYITSFKVANEEDEYPDTRIWSSAVYQPNWLPQRPKANWMDIRPDGKGWIRPREYLDNDEPLEGYFRALLQLYESRLTEANKWVGGLDKIPVICCWCPYDKAAQRQLKEFGTFVCHTAAVGRFLEDHFGMTIRYDMDREKMVRSEAYTS